MELLSSMFSSCEVEVLVPNGFETTSWFNDGLVLLRMSFSVGELGSLVAVDMSDQLQFGFLLKFSRADVVMDEAIPSGDSNEVMEWNQSKPLSSLLLLVMSWQCVLLMEFVSLS